MSISGIGQNYYHNNVATVRNTKNVNSTGKNDGFAGKVTEKNPVSPEDMTLEEYKAYFNEKMNSLYTHPSQRNRNDIIDKVDFFCKDCKKKNPIITFIKQQIKNSKKRYW